MDYSELLRIIAGAKAPKRTNAWKTILNNPDSFLSWFRSLTATQEQKISASMPQFFAALNAVPASKAAEPTPATSLPSESFEGGLATRYGLMEVEA